MAAFIFLSSISLHLLICPSVHQSIHLSLHLRIHPPTHMHTHPLSIHPFIYPPPLSSCMFFRCVHIWHHSYYKPDWASHSYYRKTLTQWHNYIPIPTLAHCYCFLSWSWSHHHKCGRCWQVCFLGSWFRHHFISSSLCWEDVGMGMWGGWSRIWHESTLSLYGNFQRGRGWLDA